MIRSRKGDFKQSSGAMPSRVKGSDAREDSAPPSLRSALDTPLGRELPKQMRRIAIKFASGVSVQQIARTEALSTSHVKDYLEYAARTLGCQPVVIDTAGTEKGNSARRPPINMEQLGFGQFLIEAKCQACGKNIEGDSERVLLIPMILTYHMDADDWGNHKMSPYVPHRASNHYCLECIHGVEQFSMPNPWFMSVEELQETTEWIEAYESKKRIGSDEKDEALRHALNSGDIRKFNAAMPTTAARDDLLARAKPVSRLAAKIADGMDGESSTAEIADQILNDHKKWENAAARQSAVSGVDAQRVTLLEYLNSPQSRGKMLQAEREAARLWAEGQSENEIARRQGVDQSTVHRRIQAAKKKAYARR